MSRAHVTLGKEFRKKYTGGGGEGGKGVCSHAATACALDAHAPLPLPP